MRIAIVEDDPDQAAFLKVQLEGDGFDCHVFADGAKAVQGLHKESYDLVLLDWCLPQTSGTDVLDWIREHLDWKIPVIFVTQRDSEEDLAYALEKGADDFLTKPI